MTSLSIIILFALPIVLAEILRQQELKYSPVALKEFDLLIDIERKDYE